MSALEQLLGQLPDRLGSGKSNHIFTPKHIAKDMVAILPEEVFHKNATFLDICCKSGIFLYEIYNRLMNSESMIRDIPDKKERREYILNNQLFGIAPDPMCQMMATRTTYGYLAPNSHIIDFATNYNHVMQNTDKRFLYDTLKEKFGMMKFDVVIGNPPYNNDAYLDFVTVGKELSKECCCMITPAKWQAKGGTKNEMFRKEIVPYMSDIIYYPDCIEVFAISENSGITYYLVDSKIHKEKTITNKAYFQPLINSVECRKLGYNDTLWNVGSKIVDKVKSSNKIKLQIIAEEDRKEYTICAGKQWCGFRVSSGAWDMKTSTIKPEFVGKGSCIFNPSGNIKVLGKVVGLLSDQYDTSSSSVHIFTSDNKEEALSFLSYITSKFVSFLILINLKGSVIFDDITLKYVPDPGSFDHIFTDKELYEKYNLTDEEINVIESVIKERK